MAPPTAPRVLVVGFDAADRDAVDALVGAGRLPTVARLMATGRVADLRNPVGLLSGPVWPGLATGATPDHHGGHSWRPLTPGTYRMEYRGPNGPVARPPVWSTLGRAGVRSVVVDVPNVALQPGFPGVQIIGWTQHDRHASAGTWPAELRRELARRFPASAEDPCDADGAAGRLASLRAHLLAQVDTKVAMVEWLLARERPDLAWVVFGESHCAGHQFWHLRDPTAPGHDPSADAELGDVVAEVYAALDAALARLLAAAGEDTTVVLVLSHGIEANITVPHLFDPVLRALDAHLGPPELRQRLVELARRTPNRVARRVLRLARRDIEPLAHYVDGSRRFFPVPTFPSYGSVRLNVEGREPNGRIRPADVPAMLGWLEQAFLDLRDADRGTPAVRRVVPVAELYPDGAAAGMGDLLIEWDVRHPIAAVTSPLTGTIRRPNTEVRTGGHRPDGRIVVVGPGVVPGGGDPVRGEDLAPTLAAWFGVALPSSDGEPMPVGSAVPTPG